MWKNNEEKRMKQVRMLTLAPTEEDFTPCKPREDQQLTGETTD